jgi:3-deoxy-manno-octulosonate cytidylyltransferase (CMP-KDO synthetase)
MIFDPNCVKVVCNTAGYALYFSRAPIPWDRDHFTNDEHTPVDLSPYQHHLGIYAYTYASVQRYCAWPSTSLEQIERLEQLRVLAHGGTIYVAPAAVNIPKGVDNLTDLQHLEQLLCAGSKAT